MKFVPNINEFDTVTSLLTRVYNGMRLYANIIHLCERMYPCNHPQIYIVYVAFFILHAEHDALLLTAVISLTGFVSCSQARVQPVPAAAERGHAGLGAEGAGPESAESVGNRP